MKNTVEFRGTEKTTEFHGMVSMMEDWLGTQT